MLDGSQDLSISDSKIWFALEHPKVPDLINCILPGKLCFFSHTFSVYVDFQFISYSLIYVAFTF